MASFCILTHPEHKTRVVKIGWSWPAFFFGLFWALYKRMWLLAASLFGFIVLSSVFIPATEGGELISNVLFIGLNLTISMKGNQWYASLLETQGFNREAQVEARNPNHALAVHANSQKSSAADMQVHDEREHDEHDDNDDDGVSLGGSNDSGSETKDGNGKKTGTFIG